MQGVKGMTGKTVPATGECNHEADMLRIILLSALLTLNLILAAALAGTFGDASSGWSGTPREPARLARQSRAADMQLQRPVAAAPASAARATATGPER